MMSRKTIGLSHISPGTTSGVPLSREGVRLLAELRQPGRYAILDPTDDDALILRCARAGVSLGGGRFQLAVGEELQRHDLVEELGSFSRRCFRISIIGLARLRRAGAGPGEAFAAQHRDLVEERIEVEGRKTTLVVNASESPLDWLRRRKGFDGEPLIDSPCFEAGERLRRDLTFGAILPRVTANWSAAVADKARGAPRDLAYATEAVIAARERATRALEAVGADFADLLIDLCGFLKGLEQIERDRGWPARSGKVVVKLALGRLADHYGLQKAARGPERSRGIRGWRETAVEAAQ
jgi:uncharacterized protein YjhX (UPF0386 family)